jgi:hypothetical protein
MTNIILNELLSCIFVKVNDLYYVASKYRILVNNAKERMPEEEVIA